MQLQKYREKSGMTQKQLAAKGGISLAMVQSIENGRRTGSVKTAVRLAGILGVTIDDLLRVSKNTDSNKMMKKLKDSKGRKQCQTQT